MAWQRWTFYDPTTDETYTLPINPKEDGERSYEKTISTMATCAPAAEGRTLIAEGADKVGEVSWSGTLLTVEARDAMVEWWEKRTQIRRTNHRGEQDWIYIDKFTPKEKHVVNRQYKATYEAHAFVLDVPA